MNLFKSPQITGGSVPKPQIFLDTCSHFLQDPLGALNSILLFHTRFAKVHLVLKFFLMTWAAVARRLHQAADWGQTDLQMHPCDMRVPPKAFCMPACLHCLFVSMGGMSSLKGLILEIVTRA